MMSETGLQEMIAMAFKRFQRLFLEQNPGQQEFRLKRKIRKISLFSA